MPCKAHRTESSATIHVYALICPLSGKLFHQLRNGELKNMELVRQNGIFIGLNIAPADQSENSL
jgi:hypothetical protein